MALINNIDWGIIEYTQAWAKQHQLFDANIQAKINNTPTHNTFILCEHPHVYTLGRNGNANNMLITDQQLHDIGATYVKIDRGGDITYHGYGQIVGYPIFDLEDLHLGLKAYINQLEQLIIDVIAQYGIIGERLQGATGVWIDATTPKARKIAAIGVKASRYVTMHGFALNVNTDLNYFTYINPCGFTDKGVTSIAQEIGQQVDINQVKQLLFNQAIKIFS